MITLAVALSLGYEVSLPARVEVAAGERASVSLTIAASEGRRISQDGPLRVALRAVPEGALELPRRRYRRSDAADARAAAPRFDLAVVGTRGGVHTLEVEIAFWLCHRRTCRPIRAHRSVQVEVRTGNSACAPGSGGTRFSEPLRHFGHADSTQSAARTPGARPRRRPGPRVAGGALRARARRVRLRGGAGRQRGGGARGVRSLRLPGGRAARAA